MGRLKEMLIAEGEMQRAQWSDNENAEYNAWRKDLETKEQEYYAEKRQVLHVQKD